MNPSVVIEYKDKKTSSGKVVDGVIYLSISSRLNRKTQQEHIDRLTGKLLSRINWARKYSFAESAYTVNTDQELVKLAQTINRNYYDLPLKDAAFHMQNSTWGTCSLKTGKIYVSHRLKGAPLELLWYVLVHEICHLAIPGHTRAFWQLVGKACPDYPETKKRLKAYGMRN